MTAKFNISVPRLVHFKGSSWAVTAVMFLLISLYANAYFWGDSYEHILSYVEVVCMLICTLSFFRAVVMFKRNYSVEAEPKLFPVQEWRMENIIVRALQVIRGFLGLSLGMSICQIVLLTLILCLIRYIRAATTKVLYIYIYTYLTLYLSMIKCVCLGYDVFLLLYVCLFDVSWD